MKMKGTVQVDDPEILDIDPVQKLWMFNQWVGDQVDSAELAKNHAYLLASFDHPEAVKELIGNGGDVHQSTDEEFEESSQMVRDMSLAALAATQPHETTRKAKRKRRLTLKEER